LVIIFKLIFVFLNENVHKCVEYCKKSSQKKLEFLDLKNIKIYIKIMFS